MGCVRQKCHVTNVTYDSFRKRGEIRVKSLLKTTQERALRYLETLDERAVVPTAEAVERLAELNHALPDRPTDPESVLALLDDVGSPATVATAGGRYLGFVVGGCLPAALAANWLAAAWDQPASYTVASPIGARLDALALDWLIDLFGLPAGCAGGLVTGATMANLSGLAAARHAILARQGWDVETQGLFGAPAVQVVVGDEVHASILKVLGILGMGRERVLRVPVDDQGRMRADALPPLSPESIVCIQAGNVNSGAFDPAPEICEAAQQAGAWVHVDGAFGLWAAASPERAWLTEGLAEADSWATDAHKWLNVPYDSGIVFCRHPEALRAAMAVSAAYLAAGEQREPCHYTPEFSRRARGVEIWAALLSLGRFGLADLVDRCCWYAARFEQGLSQAGYRVLNDVDLNQVLVSFGDEERTDRAIAALQAEGGVLVREHGSGRGKRPCASVCLPGPPLRRTWSVAWRPCCGRDLGPRRARNSAKCTKGRGVFGVKTPVVLCWGHILLCVNGDDRIRVIRNPFCSGRRISGTIHPVYRVGEMVSKRRICHGPPDGPA